MANRKTEVETPRTRERASKKANEFEPYVVRVTAKNGLNVRSKAGMTLDSKILQVLPFNGTYTIIQETVVNNQTWGFLKSRAGWICLAYTKKV